MRYKNIDNKLFATNRKRLENLVQSKSLLIINANDEIPRNGDQYYTYRQHSDLFYLTGIEQEKTILLIFKDHPQENCRQVLFIIRPNEALETWEGRKLRREEAAQISGIANIHYLDEADLILRDYIIQAQTIYLNQNEYPKFFPEVPSRDDRFAERLKREYPLHSFARLAPLLWKLRTVKSITELELMDEAIRITSDAFTRVLKTLEPGMWEFEAEAEIIYEFTRRGATHAYQPIVAAGINACSLHYHHNDQPCNDGMLLLMDFGAEYANYAADVTRTIPVNGKFTPRQRDCYNAVLRVLNEAVKLYTPGNTINKINQRVNQLMEKEMIDLGLFTRQEVENQPADKPLFSKYFMHGTAHFLGLDVHDVGGKDTPLQTGMVLTCEPGLYISEEGIGIRIEDNIMVAEEPTILTDYIPREINEIEFVMKKKKGNKKPQSKRDT
jgi:Xaa-Pro aminopeptidase